MPQNQKISIIAAIGRKRELGKQNDLIWRTKEDMHYFMEKTKGNPIIMGRKTYESIPAKFRPLKDRSNIVVTTNRDWQAESGVYVCYSLEDALTLAQTLPGEEIFIGGGAQIYSEALQLTDRLYLTLVDAEEPAADTFFPEYSQFTKTVSSEAVTTESGLSFTWVVLEKE